MRELWNILETMDVPVERIGDESWHNLGWLRRFLVIRNRLHRRYPEAMELIMIEIGKRASGEEGQTVGRTVAGDRRM